MEWIDEVGRIDKSLHRLGVPDSVRMKAVAEIMSVLATADKARRARRDVVLEAVAGCKGDVRQAAKRAGWSKSTLYYELRNRSKPG